MTNVRPLRRARPKKRLMDGRESDAPDPDFIRPLKKSDLSMRKKVKRDKQIPEEFAIVFSFCASHLCFGPVSRGGNVMHRGSTSKGILLDHTDVFDYILAELHIVRSVVGG